MPRSRNRPGHDYQKPADIPASQRVKGRIIWGILFAVFGCIIAWFAAGGEYLALIIGGVLGFIIGYIIGKNMEQAARRG